MTVTDRLHHYYGGHCPLSQVYLPYMTTGEILPSGYWLLLYWHISMVIGCGCDQTCNHVHLKILC